MPFQSLYNHVFGEYADLKNISDQHPYFSAAHFFLLKQRDASDSSYSSIAAKAALHFANPYLLLHQLDAKEIPVEIETIVPQIETVVPEPEPVLSSEEIAEETFEHRVEVTEEAVIVSGPEKIIEEPVKEETIVSKQNEPLLFEPLHTTDYFASQGIKLSEVVQPGDKMGRQLKSFTEWLKTMKKVHPDGMKEKTGNFIDPSVQKMAEKSNKEEDVITESMADVYIQQGKTNKAKEIYEKLSLLNPSKSAYFAAKLNEIQ